MLIKKIAIIGLGYVGLPLAVELSKKFDVIGFDINQSRVNALALGKDSTLEVGPEELKAANIMFTCDAMDLKQANVFIVTVPTPITKDKVPDLTPLLKASELIGKVIDVDNVVIYESTVYPGATEDDCIPVIEEVSGLTFNKDFFAGYSPERINPGDKTRRLPNIKKITSGSTPEAADLVDNLYKSIITAGTHKTSSIKVAEAAKVIENTQRDLNIALINEFSIIFNAIGIDTLEVLEAAGTKWNFLPFRPGLVGGHCIGVDPYYLTHKAQMVGYFPDVILAGRRINDGMGQYVASQLVKSMIKKSLCVNGARVLLMGLSFKENCPDIRNTKVVGIISELSEYGIQVDVYDPWVNREEALLELQVELVDALKDGLYDAVVLAVAHDEFKELGITSIRKVCKKTAIVYDLKHVLDRKDVDIRL